MENTIFVKRPFKIRNADEYDLATILDLFTDPTRSLSYPFDYENVIVKGKMGTGKTMYLRANYAYYLYSIVPSIMQDEELILPIYIKLSDFQQMKDPKKIYDSIIIKILEEMTEVYENVLDSRKMANIHSGIAIHHHLPNNSKLNKVYDMLKELSAEEYSYKLSNNNFLSGSMKMKMIEINKKTQKMIASEYKNKKDPSITDIEKVFKLLIEGLSGKLLILIDEAGSITKKFFKTNNDDSYFEIMMNQFRTASFIRTKIAVYPHTFSDVLTETRYGDVIRLEEDIFDERGYRNFRNRAISIINNYISASLNSKDFGFEDLFEVGKDIKKSDALEQIINASKGNMRRLIQLLDTSMIITYEKYGEARKISLEDGYETLRAQGKSMEDLFEGLDKDFLSSLVKACRSRQSYKFKFPNKAPVIYRYTYKSAEANILNVVELGSGRRSTTYSFDYAYCVYRNIPTHLIKSTERIDKSRSRAEGDWINRVTTLSDELLEYANMPGKITGKITWLSTDDKKSGFITDEKDIQYYWTQDYIVDSDTKKRVRINDSVRFYPLKIEDMFFAHEIEVLK